MTEQEWRNALPEPMLEFMRGKASDRKLRLVALACCRSVWDLLTHPSSRRAVELLEKYVDQAAVSDDEWTAVRRVALEGFDASRTPACQDAMSPRTPACAAAYAVAGKLNCLRVLGAERGASSTVLQELVRTAA